MMKKAMAVLLSVFMIFSCITPYTAFAETESKSQYGTLNVEYSDNIGKTEKLEVMKKDGHMYANAEKLAARLGYNFKLGENNVQISNKNNNNLPYTLVNFTIDSTKTQKLIGINMVDYEAPFSTIKNEKGSWIPFEFSLLLLNSSMMILDDTILIDMPEKKIPDIYRDLMKNSRKYEFDWAKDIGYSNSDVNIIGGSSHLVNEFNNLLKEDGDAWLQLIENSTIHTNSTCDKKYGEDIAMMMCTSSNDEISAMKKKVTKYKDIFMPDGKVGKFLSTYSDKLNNDVESTYNICKSIKKDIGKSNSELAAYNSAYRAFEKASDKEMWFSETGGTILDMQKELKNAVPIAESMGTAVEVVQYADEFATQDTYSRNAMDNFLKHSKKGTLTSTATKKAMKKYGDTLDTNLVEYSAERYYKEHIDDWIAEAINNSCSIGKAAKMELVAWNLASAYIPFLSNGISGAEKFELALYSQVLSADAGIEYRKNRDKLFSQPENLTAENFSKLSEDCYVYLKTCYITREAALASLKAKRKKVRDQLGPLVEIQRAVNDEIAEYLVKLKNAEKDNSALCYGFLPENNDKYLENYNDENVNRQFKKYKKHSDKGLYAPILEEYKLAAENDFHGDNCYDEAPDVNPELVKSGRRSPDLNLCYAFYDINGDSKQECIIADVGVADYRYQDNEPEINVFKLFGDYELYDVYHIVNGEAERVSKFEMCGYRNKYWIGNDNTIIYAGSGGALSVMVSVNQLNKSGTSLKTIDKYYSDGEFAEEPEESDLMFYYHENADGEKEEISEEQFHDRIKGIKPANNIKWMPL